MLSDDPRTHSSLKHNGSVRGPCTSRLRPSVDLKPYFASISSEESVYGVSQPPQDYHRQDGHLRMLYHPELLAKRCPVPLPNTDIWLALYACAIHLPTEKIHRGTSRLVQRRCGILSKFEDGIHRRAGQLGHGSSGEPSRSDRSRDRRKLSRISTNSAGRGDRISRGRPLIGWTRPSR
jgi:hypothetical protein